MGLKLTMRLCVLVFNERLAKKGMATIKLNIKTGDGRREVKKERIDPDLDLHLKSLKLVFVVRIYLRVSNINEIPINRTFVCDYNI